VSGPLLLVLLAGTAAILALSAAPLGATRRTGLLLVAASLLALPTSAAVAASGTAVVLVAFAADAVVARRRPSVERRVPPILARGVAGRLDVGVDAPPGVTVRVRQPQVPDVAVVPPEATGGLDARIVASRRGRHTIPAVASRSRGPLGLACWYRSAAGPADLLVYPDLPTARRIARDVRRGRFRSEGRVTRGPLGLGTDFETIRDYQPDDDVRRINWRATQRTGRPMSNEYRVEQDRDVMCLVDCGRLMRAPLGTLTRLDAALDAVCAVAYVADEVGDRCGVVAFDDTVRRHLPARRGGGDGVVAAVFDLEPSAVDSDYELAFRTVGGSKRALVLVLTDLLDEAAASALLDAVPVLARRHAVVVAGVRDPGIGRIVSTPPDDPSDVFDMIAALDVLAARDRVAAELERAGATVIEAPPGDLPAACVAAYLSAKARARL